MTDATIIYYNNNINTKIEVLLIACRSWLTNKWRNPIIDECTNTNSYHTKLLSSSSNTHCGQICLLSSVCLYSKNMMIQLVHIINNAFNWNYLNFLLWCISLKLPPPPTPTAYTTWQLIFQWKSPIL